jgi:hypothetical protein
MNADKRGFFSFEFFICVFPCLSVSKNLVLGVGSGFAQHLLKKEKGKSVIIEVGG